MKGQASTNWLRRCAFACVLTVLCPRLDAALTDIRGATTDYDRIRAAEPYADLAESAYQPGREAEGFTILGSQQNPSGFQAVTYKRDDQVVIAFTGSQDTTDWKTNLKTNLLSATPAQFQEAKEYVEKVKAENQGATVSLTGHSLGGQLALYAGGVMNLDAISFNAPGPNRSMRTEIKAAEALLEQTDGRAASINFSAREAMESRVGPTRDWPSSLIEHYGQTVTVPSSAEDKPANTKLGRGINNVGGYHSIERMKTSIRSALERGRDSYQEDVAIWKGIDEGKRQPKTRVMSVPTIDFANKTTLGGGASPLPLPGVPPLPGTRPAKISDVTPDSIYRSLTPRKSTTEGKTPF